MDIPKAADIPVGRENAITREQLKRKWNCSDRIMRRYIADLRAQDDGDDYVIVSYSSGKGYYRTDNPDVHLPARAHRNIPVYPCIRHKYTSE